MLQESAIGSVSPGTSSLHSEACYVQILPQSIDAPLVFASPHSGREYPPDFLAATRLGCLELRRSEDSFVDELLAGVPGQGAAVLAALFPRSFCDANREAWELDPGMFEGSLPDWVNTTSARVRAGLGTIARVVSGGEAIYAERLRFAEAEYRVRAFWQPYHQALAGLLEATLAREGYCLLVDCHSMPAHACEGRRPAPDVVLGDVHGAACAPAITEFVEHFFIQQGYRVRRNDPYAGGYITRHYGRPERRMHTIQLEFARSLYMDEATLQKCAGFARLANNLTLLATALASNLDRLANQR